MQFPVRERDIERSLVSYAKKRHVLTYKFTSPAQRGVPDRIFIANGHVLFLEIKRPGQEPTVLQHHTLAQMRGAGANAQWVDNVDAGKKLIDWLAGPHACPCTGML